jgi:hypothetical protein
VCGRQFCAHRVRETSWNSKAGNRCGPVRWHRQDQRGNHVILERENVAPLGKVKADEEQVSEGDDWRMIATLPAESCLSGCIWQLRQRYVGQCLQIQFTWP